MQGWGTITALSEGLTVRDELSEDAVRRTLESAREQLRLARGVGAEKSFGLMTEATRRARNGDRLRKALEDLVDSVKILNPQEEAHLAFLANRVLFGRVSKLAVIDMGGGSVQIAIGAKSPETFASLPLGVSVLTEQFLHTDPPTPEEINRIREYVSLQLQSVAHFKDVFPGALCVILGGSMASLAALDAGLKFFREQAVMGYHLRCDRLRLLEEKLARLSVAERQTIPLMSDRRAEVVLTGAIVLSLFCDFFGISEMVYSGFGIRHGLAVELQRQMACQQSNMSPC